MEITGVEGTQVARGMRGGSGSRVVGGRSAGNYGETNLDIDIRSKEAPQLAPRHPDALRVRRLGRLRFQLPGA